MPVDLSLKFWLGLLLGALVVLFIFVPLARNLFNLLPSNVDEGTYSSFLELDKAISEVAQNVRENKEIPFYIKPDAYILVGFNKECGFNENDKDCPVANCHDTDSDYYIPKPKTCSSNKACLCLFSDFNLGDFDGEDNEPIIPCTSYSDVDYLVGKKGEGLNDGVAGIINGVEHESLVIYGSCGEEWGVNKIRVEKKVENNEVMIIIGA
ncbi:MAG: hypothetical protein AABX08_01900 [Nanoarchaeota archaeon]